MTEYIERDYLMADRVGNDPVRIAAKCAPAADVEPVSHAYWIHDEVSSEHSITGTFILPSCQCSKCGLFAQHESTFCPNCGAKMDLES